MNQVSKELTKMHLEYASDSNKSCTETSCSKTLEHYLAMLGHTGAPARIQCARAHPIDNDLE